MAKQLDVTLLIRNSPAATWAANNPTLAKGEIGIEIDSRKFKIGDGVTPWISLKYASGGAVEVKNAAPTTTDTGYDVGTLWLDTSQNKLYILVAKSASAVWMRLANATELEVVAEAIVAQKLKTPRNINLSGDGTGTGIFDGSADVSIVLVLANSGITAGTYTKLTVNSKGIVTSATTLTAADIPTLTLSKISDAGTAASKSVGTAAGNIPTLDTNGKLPESTIPALAISDVYEVASQAAMLALSAQVGDVAVRTDENKSYILKQTPASTFANWILLRTPTDAVLSVNGQTGAVTLTTSNITEGSNLYYTAARDTANFNTNFATKKIADLSDGANAILTTDTLIINGGGA